MPANGHEVLTVTVCAVDWAESFDLRHWSSTKNALAPRRDESARSRGTTRFGLLSWPS